MRAAPPGRTGRRAGRALWCAGRSGRPEVPKNIVKASRAETHSSAPRTAPPAVVRWTAARIAAHGSPSPNGMSVDSATCTSALQQGGHPPQLVVFGGGDVGRGTGRRARRRSWAGSRPSTPRSARSAMLSSGTTAACSMRSCGWRARRRAAPRVVTTSWAAVTQCTATGASAAWRSAIHAVSSVEVEVVVVQDALARRQAVHALTQLAAPVRLHQLHDVADFEVRRGVGDAGDAVCAQPAADLGQSAFVALQRVRPAAVGAAQPAVGVIGQPHPGQPRRVQRPQHAAAVLHADRDRRRHLVEHVAVQRSCDRFVVADRPDPAVAADVGVGERAGQVVAARAPPRARPGPTSTPRPPSADGRGGRAGPG